MSTEKIVADFWKRVQEVCPVKEDVLFSMCLSPDEKEVYVSLTFLKAKMEPDKKPEILQKHGLMCNVKRLVDAHNSGTAKRFANDFGMAFWETVKRYETRTRDYSPHEVELRRLESRLKSAHPLVGSKAGADAVHWALDTISRLRMDIKHMQQTMESKPE